LALFFRAVKWHHLATDNKIQFVEKTQ